MKLGVVLEGGAAFSAFQAGALVELNRQGIQFTHVTGVSAGALNGCAVVLGRTQELAEIWRKFKGLKIINFRHLKWNLSPFDLSRTTKNAIETHFPADQLMKSEVEFAICTTQLPSLKRIIHTNRQNIDVVATLRASNLIPFLHSRRIKLNGHYHIDGGLVDNVPIDVPFEAGCDRAIAIVYNHYGYIYRKRLTFKKEPLSAYGKRLVVIHPKRRLPMKYPFDFHGDRMEEVLDMGCEAAKETIDSGALN